MTRAQTVKTFQYRIYPTKKQEPVLEQTLHECRWLYNHFLENRKTTWEERQERLGLYDQLGALPALKVERMVHNHCLARSISDAAWAEFAAMLRVKAEWAGRAFVAVNPAYTSQDCSRCGHRQKMPLSDRVYACPCCHLEGDRDLNAALNILRLGLQALGLWSREATLL
jgi:putative transposase